MSSDDDYRGWVRPGPEPPGGVELEEGETLDFIAGRYRIFQFDKGHRFSTDDVLTAWYGTQWAPRVDRALDLGSGIGSVAILAAWRLPGARFVTIEAQRASVRLARKSICYNGLEERVTILEADFRDDSILSVEAPFDLVLGSPPYFPMGTASEATHPQAIPARIEIRGTIADYAAVAASHLAPGGIFAFVFSSAQTTRAESAVWEAGLAVIRRRDVVFKEGKPHGITLFAAARRGDLPESIEAIRDHQPFVEPPLVVRDREGRVSHEYSVVRLSFGIPPGNVPRGDGP